MRIRPAVLKDAPHLARIHVAAWRAAYRGQMPDQVLDELSLTQRTADWRRWLREPGPGITWLAEVAGAAAGFCVFGPSRDADADQRSVGEIVALNVAPELWRCGCGSALCQAVVDEARRRRWHELTLWTLRSNAAAQSFYRALGFAPDGALRRDSSVAGVALEELRMRLALG